MPFKRIERCVAGIRAPVAIKIQVGFLLVIGVLLVTGVVSLLAIAGIRRQAKDLDQLDEAVHLALGVDHSIVLQEHLSSMFLLTAEEIYSTKLIAEQQRFRAVVAQLGPRGATGEEIAALDQAFAHYEGAADTVRQLRRAGDDRQAQHIHVSQEHTIAHQIEGLTKALVARMKTMQQDKHREILTAQQRTTWTVSGVFVFSVALALALGSVLARSILDPVAKVDTALNRIAGGEFVTVDDVNNRDELGSLVSNVNRMSRQLADLYAKKQQTAQTGDDAPEGVSVSGREAAESRGRETILLVEDEPDIRDFVAEVLQGRGYTVLEARDGEDALRVVEQYREPLHLVLTDVVMPKLGGRDLVTRLLAQHPHLHVLYMSGYTDDALGARGVLEAGATLLSKPFTPQQLVSKVRQVLDATGIDKPRRVP